MNNFMVLFVGELQRMKRYLILGASLVVSLLWIGVLHFTEIQDVSQIFPLLIFLDATSMAILLIGVTMFFEKQEGTLKTLLVSPISKAQYITAKAVANIASNLETLFILYLYARFFKEININIIGLIGVVILIAFFHSLIGFIITYYSKDFTELLIGMMKYLLLMMLPVLFEQMGIITNDVIKKFFYALPTKASMVLLQATADGFQLWEIYLSLGYLILISGALYFLVLKKFDAFALKESGV